MEDIPQPASEPYDVGDTVTVYLGEEDVDSQFHGLICEVTDILTDDVDDLTGRETDRYSYRLQRVDTGDTLPIMLRHSDLIPGNEEVSTKEPG